MDRRRGTLCLRAFGLVVGTVSGRRGCLGISPHRGDHRERPSVHCRGLRRLFHPDRLEQRFESLRLYSLQAHLPQLPGGVLGELVSRLMSRGFGFTGSTLILLILWGVGLSLLTGLSWVVVIEKLGGAIESAYVSIRERWQDRQDRKAGEKATVQREEIVEVERKRFEEHEPIRIEPPRAAIAKSDRVIKEKQKPLFEDLPDSPLPPLHLLDEPPADIEMLSAETLEYTSRLIEKKLLRFRHRRKSGGCATRPGDYPLRDRAGHWRQRQPGHQSGKGFGASPVSRKRARGRNHPREILHGIGNPQSEAAGGAVVGDPRVRGSTRRRPRH